MNRTKEWQATKEEVRLVLGSGTMDFACDGLLSISPFQVSINPVQFYSLSPAYVDWIQNWNARTQPKLPGFTKDIWKM